MTSRLRAIPERSFRTALLFLLLTLLLLLPGTGTIPLMDRDEPRFAQATEEMRRSREWVIPYFNGEFRFDKPPLTYWWMSLHYFVLGKTEIAARLHSIIATWLSAFFIYRLGRFLYSPKAGFLAGLGFMTCFQVLIHGRLSVADLPMVLAVVITMDACARLLFAESRPRRFGPAYWQLVGGLVLGFLAKGPVAWAIPLLGILLMRWPLARVPVAWGNLQPWSAILVSLGIVALWGIAALWQTNGAYWQIGIGEHVVHRGVAALNGRLTIPGIYYLGTAIISLLPWSPLGASALFPGTPMRGDLKRGFLTGWFVAPFLVFAFYATQLPHYVLPGFAPFFLLMFREGILARPRTRSQIIWSRICLTVAFTITVLLVAVAVTPWPEPISFMAPTLWCIAGTMILLSTILPLILIRVRSSRSRWIATASTFAGAAVLLSIMATNLRQHHPAVQLQSLLSSTDKSLEFVGCGFTEPSLVFYVNAESPWRFYGNVKELPSILTAPSHSSLVVALNREWQWGKIATLWWSGLPILPTRDESATIASAVDPTLFSTTRLQGYNIARSTWVELIVIRSR
jgi:4-amino-4-deoxy-L-arabinose transferase-like glycosyltransferase